MRFLVTGHCGYIGPVLIRLLHEAGHSVVGFDTGYFRDLIENAPESCFPDEEIRKDIRDIEQSDFKGIDAVVHLAALSNDPLGEMVEKQTHEINTVGTIRCAQAAKLAGVERFVFASSCSIYGASGDAKTPLDENAPLAPVSAYAVSKVDSEAALQQLKDDSFFPVMLRNATAYGVSPRMRLDLVVANLMASGYATGTIKVLSDGTPWRPLVHIEDISRAAHCAGTADRNLFEHNVFNIGARDCNYTVADIAKAVAAELPGCKTEITGEAGNDPRSYRVDFSRALNGLPAFEPQWNVEKGAKETLEWLKAHPADLERLFGPDFIRLKHLRKLSDNGQIDEEFRWAV